MTSMAGDSVDNVKGVPGNQQQQIIFLSIDTTNEN